MRILIPILILLVAIGTVWSDSITTKVTSLRFNQSEKFLSTSANVWHMELDLYRNDERILFNTYEELNSTDGRITTSILVTAPESDIRGFTQINSTHVGLVDHCRHCIMVLDRSNRKLRRLPGNCDTSSYVEGGVGNGRLYSAYRVGVGVDKRNPDRLLITHSSSHTLISVDLLTGELVPVIKSGFRYPGSMLWASNRLVVTNRHYISEVSWPSSGTVTNAVVAGSTIAGYADGSFDKSRFNYPHDLAEVGHDLILTADSKNRKLRLMNMKTRRVIPVCIHGESVCTTGSTLSIKPYSLLSVGHYFYVGMHDRIHLLSGASAQ